MEDRYPNSKHAESSAGWTGDRIAGWESPDYIQRIDDREQEKYLAEWCRKHDRKGRRRKEKN